MQMLVRMSSATGMGMLMHVDRVLSDTALIHAAELPYAE